MCTAVVGGKDYRKLEQLLKNNALRELELIPIAWKQQNNEGYTRRLQEHEGVIKMCRAIKLEKMNVKEELQDFKEAIEVEEATTYIVDVFPATHATSTGVVYV